jgi:hypothetical protein
LRHGRLLHLKAIQRNGRKSVKIREARH